MTQTSRRATLESIADAAGVSRQTVSNVINAPHRVKAATRERVESLIAAAGYRPSAAAQALRRQRSQTIALRMFRAGDGVNGAVMDRFLHALVGAAQDHGHRIMLFAAQGPDAEVAAIADLAHRGVVDGCVLTDTVAGDPRPADLTAAGVGFVAFGRPWGDADATHAWVDIDGAAATASATQALWAQEAGPVGFIGWPGGSGAGADRRAGWLSVAASRGPLLEAAVEDEIGQGRAAMARLIERGARAAVCASDSLAVGALLAWHDRFGAVPASPRWPIVGFEDTALARFRSFSSVAQPVEEAARACMRLLMAQLGGQSTGALEPVLLTPDLILRDTDGSEHAVPRPQH